MNSNKEQSLKPRPLSTLPRRRLSPIAALLVSVSLAVSAFPQRLDPKLADLSLEELANVPAVVAAKLPSQLFEAPTGSFVFDSDDIESLPVDSIPEMLRYAPGVHIIRPSNGIWGLGMRGINSRFFNRVQFTVDEQNVYSLIFAGLFGNQHDMLLEDVASVEVAYGPGGGTWDNNAVNGRVNVLMKTAFETEGSLFKTTIGTENNGAAARIGWAIDETTSARVYAKANVRDSSFTRFDYSNRWDTARAGFRLDKRLSSHDLLSISTETFYSYLGYAYDLANFDTGALDFTVDAEKLRGANAQLKWTRNNPNGSAYSIRNWFAYSDLDAPYAAFSIASAGIEARARIRVNDRHILNLNLGGSYDEERTSSTEAADWTSPFIKNFFWYTGFQSEWDIIPEKLKLSWGLDTRFEDKSSDLAASPNTRLIFQPSQTDRFWISYSEAERHTPVSLTVMDSLRSGKSITPPLDITTPFGDFSLDRNLGEASSRQELDTEMLDAFELGYRRHFADAKASLSINAFYYDYDNLFARVGQSATPVLNVEQPYLSTRLTYENALKGEGYGFETSVSWTLSEMLGASFTYSRLIDSFDPIITPQSPFEAGLLAFSIEEFDNSTPSNMATLNLNADFNDHWKMNTGLRYTDSYSFAKGGQPSIFQLDARLTWLKTDKFKLSLVGRNLLDPRTQEARLKDFFGHWTEVEREFYLEAKAEF